MLIGQSGTVTGAENTTSDPAGWWPWGLLEDERPAWFRAHPWRGAVLFGLTLALGIALIAAAKDLVGDSRWERFPLPVVVVFCLGVLGFRLAMWRLGEVGTTDEEGTAAP